jgi:hypothetical protein
MDTAWTLVRDVIRDDLGMRHAKFTPKFGGHTGAYTGIMTASDDYSVFIKWAGEREPFGREALRREIAAHQWLPKKVTGKACLLAHRESEEGVAAAFGANLDPSPHYWSQRSLTEAVDATVRAHAALRETDAPISLPDTEARLHRVLDSKDNPWRKQALKFADMAYDDDHYNDICHTDLHRGNVLIGATGGTEIVDWAWVTRIPTVYDFVMLAVDAAVDGFDVYQVAKYAGVKRKEFQLGLAAYAGTLFTLATDEHKHARTRQIRQNIIASALKH